MPTTLGKLYRGGEFKIKGELDERSPLVCDLNTIEVRATGFSSTNATDRYIKINGYTVLTQNRGIGVVRLDEFGNIVDYTTYDTHASSTAVNDFVKMIRLTPDGYTLIMATYDQPVPLGNVNNMPMIKPTLESLGFTKLDWNYRCAWIGICYKGGRVIAEELAYGDYTTTYCYTKVQIPKGVIYYPLDNSLISHNGINGGNSKLLFSWREKKTFNGTSDYVDVGPLNLDFSKGFYIKFKARWDALQNWSRIIDFGNGNPSQNIVIANYSSTNKLRFYLHTTSGEYYVNIDNSITVGSLDEYIISIDNNKNLKIYKNKTQIYSGVVNALPENVNRTYCYIGKSNWASDSLFNGYIEYVEIREGAYDLSYDGVNIRYNHQYNGYYIGEGTTNLCTSTDFSSGWWKSSAITTIERVQVPFIDGTIVWALRGKYSGSGDGHFGWNFTYSGAANKKFSLKFYVKATSGSSMHGSCYIQENGGSYRTITSTKTFTTLPTEWTEVRLTGTAPADCLDNLRIIFRPSNNTTDYVYYTMPIVEVNTEPTEYTNSSVGHGYLDLPVYLLNNNCLNKGSLILKYTPLMTRTLGSYPAIITASWWTADNSKDWIGIYRGNGWSSADIITFSITDKSAAQSVYSVGKSGINSLIYNDLYICITWDVDNKKFQSFIYNKTTKQLIHNNSNTNNNFNGFDVFEYFKVGYLNKNSDAQNAIISDIYIYNKPLTQSEFEALAKGKVSLKVTGNIWTSRLSERVNNLPSDVYHFPLNCDTYDITKTYNASEATNLVFEDGAVFVGKNSANLLSNSSFEVDSNSDGIPDNYYISSAHGGSVTCQLDSSGINGGKCVKLYKNDWTNQVDDKYSHLNITLNVSSNTTYTLSCYYKLILNSTLTDAPRTFGYVIYGFDVNNNVVQTLVYWSFEATTDWKRKTYIFTTGSNVQSIKIEFRMSCNGYVFLDNVSLRQVPFLIPYDLSTDSSLEFNLNSTLGLDWSGNWSIVYFKKPVGTHSNNLIGYNIESLGCNSNSVGGSYIWWGKDYTNNTLKTDNVNVGTVTQFSCTFSDINNEYFNQWSMISLVKNGTTITIKEWLKNGVFLASHLNNGTALASNAFVTQYGYDLKLGGWDNGNPVNSFYRDLIIAKRALTDTELDKIYRTLIKQKDYIQIQHSIYENSL